ncbi:hypothetical protein ACTJKN_24195 [Pedobacter sp. 22163]|uniref:hypothetical protein n=1 Tax=Pedobacter sp. 22163 TaxID=3453883 RepID=UPI003F83D374
MGADGQIISVKLAESDIYKQVVLRRLNCYTIHYYGHNYVESVGGSDYWYENGSETYCQNESGVDYGPNGGDYGDMGSGGGGTNGNSNSNGTNKDIHNKTTDLCISNTVEAALRANKDILGAMADIIKNFDASKTVNINIYDGYIYYKDQYGNNDITRPKPGLTTNQQFMGNSFSADITLGIDYHDGTSKENLISSMIHEIVHAYLGYTSNNFLKIETDHNVIAEKYITPMAHYLNSSFGIQMSDAYALAWSGVSDSKVFNAATPNDTEFTVVYGSGIPNGKITVGDINRIAGAYKLSTKIPANNGYTKGSKICD